MLSNLLHYFSNIFFYSLTLGQADLNKYMIKFLIRVLFYLTNFFSCRAAGSTVTHFWRPMPHFPNVVWIVQLRYKIKQLWKCQQIKFPKNFLAKQTNYNKTFPFLCLDLFHMMHIKGTQQYFIVTRKYMLTSKYFAKDIRLFCLTAKLCFWELFVHQYWCVKR